MTITLYKDVELRNDYSLVFDNDASFWGGRDNTPFYRYLQLKSGITVDVPNIYFANSGNITIDWSYFNSYPTGITYMEIFTETAPNRKYFFVDSYDYNNGMITLYYTMDVWHTYSPSMRLYNGVINRARYGIDGRRHALPMEYTTNLPLQFNGTNRDETFYLAAEFSVYSINSDSKVDDATSRINYTTLIGNRSYTGKYQKEQQDYQLVTAAETVPYTGVEYTYTYQDIPHVINQLTSYQGVEPVGMGFSMDWRPVKNNDAIQVGLTHQVFDKVGIYNEELSKSLANTADSIWKSLFVDNLKRLRYEIIQFYLLPTNMFPDITTLCYTAGGRPLNTSVKIEATFTETNEDGVFYNNYGFEEYYFYKLNASFKPILQGNAIVSASPTTVGIGFRNLFMPFSYTGQYHSIRFEACFSPCGFSMSMIGEDGIHDITQEFEIPMPYTAPSGVEKKLATLGYQNAKRQLVATTTTTAIQAAADIAAISLSGGSAAAGIAAREAVVKQGAKAVGAAAASQAAKTSRLTSERLQVASKSSADVASRAIGLTYGANNIVDAYHKLKTPVSAGTANNGTAVGLLNAVYGFGTYTISPNNLDEVNYLISRVGYDTFIRSNDYHHDVGNIELKDNYYEPIQFATVNVSGGFSNDVRDTLETILLEGTIIAYDEDVFAQL